MDAYTKIEEMITKAGEKRTQYPDSAPYIDGVITGLRMAQAEIHREMDNRLNAQLLDDLINSMTA